MLLTANTRGACSAPLPPWFSSRRAKQLAGLYPGFHLGKPVRARHLRNFGSVRQSVTQTPEDRRAADSAVEVLGAAATPAGFTVRTLKLLVTATRTGRTGSPSPGPGPGVTGRPVFKGSGPGPAGRRGVTVTVPASVKSWTSRYNVLGELGLERSTHGEHVLPMSRTSVPKF